MESVALKRRSRHQSQRSPSHKFAREIPALDSVLNPGERGSLLTFGNYHEPVHKATPQERRILRASYLPELVPVRRVFAPGRGDQRELCAHRPGFIAQRRSRPVSRLPMRAIRAFPTGERKEHFH